MILVPSLINPAEVLDLSERQSLVRWLAAQGMNSYLVDWGAPTAEDRARDLGGHVSERLLPLVSQFGAEPIYVGYCLGGTLAIGAAATAGAKAVATIAAPWNFDGFTADARDEIGKLWTEARPLCERLGYVPMEVLQSGFWALDPGRTIRKYAAFADMKPGSDGERAFLTVEDWANEGAPLTFGAAQQLFEQLYGANLTGRGLWEIDGARVDAAALPCPTFSVGSTTDRIVPASAAPPLATSRTLALGHVGMIVGGRAREMLWEPLAAWLFNHGA